jgi:GR25 family glycosyltransferase involved in LPS biosynthesis
VKVNNTCLTNKMLAVANSHLKAWKLAYLNGDRFSLIMEDDVIFGRDFKKVIESIDFINCDILYLGSFFTESESCFARFLELFYGHCESAGRVCDIPQTGHCMTRHRLALGTHCYVVTRRGLRSLIENVSRKITNHIDVQIQSIAVSGEIVAHSVCPPIAFQFSAMRRNRSPTLLNKLVDGIFPHCNPSMSFCLSTPFSRLLDCEVNGWTIVGCLILLTCEASQGSQLLLEFHR